MLLRSTTLETAHKVVNRFRQAVERYHFPQVGRITVSVGFVSTSSNTPVEILGQADQALYFAKKMAATKCVSTTSWLPAAI